MHSQTWTQTWTLEARGGVMVGRALVELGRSVDPLRIHHSIESYHTCTHKNYCSQTTSIGQYEEIYA